VTTPGPFPLRGLKGLWWEPEQYLGWPELLAEAGYDFFMLCYTFCPETGLRWRQPFRASEVEIIGRLAADCAARGITLCLALHPLIGGQAWSPDEAAVHFHPTTGRGWFTSYWQARRPGETLQPDPPIRYGSDDDLVLLTSKARQARALGVEAIALCLDDVDPGTAPARFGSLAAAHLSLVNALRGAVTPRLFVVPTYYWTEGAAAHAEYTAELARGLPPDVDVFWTGQVVRDHDITAAKAREAAGLFGRKPVVWLNYASNDSFRFMPQLPPDRPPAPDLAPETAGLLLNSTRQVGLARLDARIIGAYLANPAGYDHQQAVERAVVAVTGETAALLQIAECWRAVPDVRTLTTDLQAGGRPLLDDLLGRLRPALATLQRLIPLLDPSLTDRQIWNELAAGLERVGLLVAALAVLETELAAVGSHALTPVVSAPSPARTALLARLAGADPEAACDAEAILALGPAVSTP